MPEAPVPEAAATRAAHARRLKFVPVQPRDRRAAALLLMVIGAAALALAFVNPSDHAGLPACPTWRFLGIYCPGCGSTRATHWLLNARPDLAWRFNPLLVAVGIPLGVVYISSLASSALLGMRPTVRVPVWIAYVAAVLLLLYMGVRNLPSERVAWLRPPTTALQRDAGSVSRSGPAEGPGRSARSTSGETAQQNEEGPSP